jgi:hypothetical protein
MALAFTVLGTLGLWAMIVTRDHTDSLSRAGVQTSGHMRAAQALGQIDTHTDLLEDGIDPQIVARLRTAQRVLGESLQRMQRRSVVARERRLAHDAEPQVEALRPTIEAFLAAVAPASWIPRSRRRSEWRKSWTSSSCGSTTSAGTRRGC